MPPAEIFCLPFVAGNDKKRQKVTWKHWAGEGDCNLLIAGKFTLDAFPDCRTPGFETKSDINHHPKSIQREKTLLRFLKRIKDNK